MIIIILLSIPKSQFTVKIIPKMRPIGSFGIKRFIMLTLLSILLLGCGDWSCEKHDISPEFQLILYNNASEPYHLMLSGEGFSEANKVRAGGFRGITLERKKGADEKWLDIEVNVAAGQNGVIIHVASYSFDPSKNEGGMSWDGANWSYQDRGL
ncbi:hypothetical protein [Jiulongibacter sediminis]|uniref:hypothetical protein n=1 Tax=Jiulongibacter sediminis TaxID=1605367 RepID=UPI0026EE82A5|nr:hypothetical protein [Jiulongibacter sediminis]